MNRSIRRGVAVLAAVCAALAPMAATAAAAIHYTHESYLTFQQQLSGGKIHAVTFNKKAHTVRITLVDGDHMLASYPPHNEPQIKAQLEAKGVPVAVLQHKAKPVHHTLRYIAGGILVVVILAILLVLLIGRRRSMIAASEGDGDERDAGYSQGEGTAAGAG